MPEQVSGSQERRNLRVLAPFSVGVPSLYTQRLLLRAPRLSDAADVFFYSQDPEVARYVLWDPHLNIGESRDFLRSLIRKNREGGPKTFIIEEKYGGRAVGTIGFVWLDQENQSCEIGYSLARPCWNKGYMTEALQRLIRYAFETLGLNRIEGQHDVRNPASGAVMRHAGMRCEGLLRQRLFCKGDFSDVRLYALVREDWEALGQKTSEKEDRSSGKLPDEQDNTIKGPD